MKRLLTTAAFAAAALPAFSQTFVDGSAISIGSNFFVALVCGVIIAFAIQYLLTALSVAVGISAAPNLKEKYAEVKARDSRDADDNTKWNEFSHEADETPTGVKISSGVGIWNTITTAIALFTGTAFAMTLVPFFAETVGTAATLALTIWGTFFMLLFWLESRFASTIVGGLISTATSGLKQAASGVANLVAPSPASQVQSVADATIDKLEASFGGSFDTDRIVSAIENFGSTVDNRLEKNLGKLPSYDKLVKDLRNIMNDSSKKSGSNPAKWTAIQSLVQTAIESGDSSGSEKGKQKSAQLKQLLTELKAEYDKSGDAKSAATKVASDKTGVDDAKIDEYISQIEKTLQTSHEEDMQAETLLGKIQDIVDRNGVSTEGLSEKLSSFDRDDVATLIASNTSLSKEKVDTYVDQAVTALSTVREKLQSKSSSDTSLMEQVSELDLQELTEQAKKAIAEYINVDDSPQAMQDYSVLKRDLVKAMNNPSDTLTILQNRLKTFNPDAIVAALPVRANSTADAKSQLLQTLNEAKAEVEMKANELQTKAHGALRQAERRAVIEAEHARKTAASAAWWLVVSIVVSGVAALGGAILA